MKNRITTDELHQILRQAQIKSRSAWEKGVYEYSIDFVFNLELFLDENDSVVNSSNLKDILLNGAENFIQYSWGGLALIYDRDIATRLCTPSELKRTDNGTKRPNKNEEWLDAQARALYQAYMKIKNIIIGKELVY